MAKTVDKPSPIYLEHPSKIASDSCGLLTAPTLTLEEEEKAWRKIDIRLIPILALLYFFFSLDRGTAHQFSSVFLAHI